MRLGDAINFNLPKTMPRLMGVGLLILLASGSARPASAQMSSPDWRAIEEETMRHFQALLRLDTSNPPGNETRAAAYLKDVLEKEGIPVQIFSLETDRANLVATLKGSGSRRPLLLMGHTDVVTVVPERWTHPPFAAVRNEGYVYGRGALDDKDNLAASLMMMLLLKRAGTPLDRDVIFLAEAGEESTTRVGIDFMVERHLGAIAAEYCLAEGGGVRREGGVAKYATIGTLEKIPRSIDLVARGPSGHGSVPLQTNAVARLAAAVVAVSTWDPPVRLNDTTREYFRRLAAMSSGAEAERFQALLSGDPARIRTTVDYFSEHSPGLASLLRTSISPTILRAGDRTNVIPSEARATLDVRLLPDENPDEVLGLIRRVVNDSSVEVAFSPRIGNPRPAGGTSIDTDAFRTIEAAVKKHYDVVALPTMSTGATDAAQVRSKGTNCYGIGPATDSEDGAKGFGAHGDQERILESELHRFVRFYYDVVLGIAERR